MAAAAAAVSACGSEESAGNPNDGFLDDAGSGGSGGSRFNDGSSTGGQSTGGGNSPIGRRCLEDSDCGGGDVVCLLESGSDFAGGGPAGGICTVDCSADGNPTCAAVDPAARCVIVDDLGTISQADDLAYCFPGCLIGDPNPGEVKCQGRFDLTCFESTSSPGAGFCQPACGGDFDCGTGRICDFGLGVCVDPPTEALLPIGSECDPMSEERQCAGACLRFSEDYAVCSGFCNLGEPGCGSDPDSMDPFQAFCLLSVGDPDLYSIGDAGFCMELCDCDDECAHPDAVCDAFSDRVVQSLGRRGVCVPLAFSANPDAGVGIACDGTPPPTADAGGNTEADAEPPPADAASAADGG